MTSVLCLPEHSAPGELHATAYIRLLRPLEALARQGSVELRSALSAEFDACDVVILERFFHPSITLDEASRLIDAIRARSRHFLYTLDDNLLDLGADEPWRSPIGEPQRAAVRLFLREADGVIVSTTPLAERHARLARRIEVVENALDESLFAGAPAARDPARDAVHAVYMGTGTHQQDLLHVLEPLRRVLRRHRGKFRLDILGVSPDASLMSLFQGLPVEAPGGFGGMAYPRFAAWWAANARWDFGIAPLRPDRFNRYKSDIKLLDYGIVGIPGIFSDGPAYSATARQGETGLLCGPEPDEWEERLESMISQAELRRRLSERVREYVMRERVLGVRAARWGDAIERLCKGASNA